MIGVGIGTNAGTIAAVYMALALFGIGYNWLTAWAEQTGFIRGYTAFFVVGGVMVILALSAILVGLLDALIVAGAFVFAGTPMILGSMIRHKREELRMLEQLRREAEGDRNV